MRLSKEMVQIQVDSSTSVWDIVIAIWNSMDLPEYWFSITNRLIIIYGSFGHSEGDIIKIIAEILVSWYHVVWTDFIRVYNIFSGLRKIIDGLLVIQEAADYPIEVYKMADLAQIFISNLPCCDNREVEPVYYGIS